MKTIIHVVGISLISALGIAFAPAGDAKSDPLALRQGEWTIQGGGGQLGREAQVRKLGLPFYNREFAPKITLTVKDDRWTMTHSNGTTKGKLAIRKGDKLDEIDLTIDAKEGEKQGVQLLGVISPLTGDSWLMIFNLPGKTRPTFNETANADFSYAWRRAK